MRPVPHPVKGGGTEEAPHASPEHPATAPAHAAPAPPKPPSVPLSPLAPATLSRVPPQTSPVFFKFLEYGDDQSGGGTFHSPE